MKEQLKIKTIKKETVKSPFANGYCNKYRLELLYKDNKYRFNFFDSVRAYCNNERLKKDDALYSVLMDSMAYDSCRDEKDFLNEFGYDEFDLYNYYRDGYSISDLYEFAAKDDVLSLDKGLKAYKGCKSASIALHDMFTNDELNELQAEFAEY